MKATDGKREAVNCKITHPSGMVFSTFAHDLWLGADKEYPMADLVPVFISFDYDHDEDLRVMLLGQAKNPESPFSIADWSVKEAMTGDWKGKVQSRMRRTKVMAVICGHYTHTATGVNAEIKIAREIGLPYFLLSGRSSGVNRKPTAALSSDKIYNWTWDNLKALIHGGR